MGRNIPGGLTKLILAGTLAGSVSGCAAVAAEGFRQMGLDASNARQANAFAGAANIFDAAHQLDVAQAGQSTTEVNVYNGERNDMRQSGPVDSLGRPTNPRSDGLGIQYQHPDVEAITFINWIDEDGNGVTSQEEFIGLNRINYSVTDPLRFGFKADFLAGKETILEIYREGENYNIEKFNALVLKKDNFTVFNYKDRKPGIHSVTWRVDGELYSLTRIKLSE